MGTSFRTMVGCAVAALALTATACGSSTPSTSSASTSSAAPAAASSQVQGSSSSAPKGGLSAQAQQAADVVAAATGPHNTFQAPGPAITGTKNFSGKVVYYVAAAIGVPLFKQLADSLAVAFKSVGVELRVCDAKGNPQDAASCLGQAVDAHAAAVIAGGFPDQYSPVAFKAVRDAGIPLLYTLVTPVKSTDPKRVGYISPDLFELESLNANWVIADSDAEAHVLVVEATDNPDLIAWVEQGALAKYKANCSGCAVKVVTTNVADLDKLPSLVTAALVGDPSINYVQVAFDDRLQATLQGIQASGSKVKVVSEDGTLSAMQTLATGNLLAAEVGYDTQSFSWYSADRVLRMMANQDAGDYTLPIRRLFTKDSAAKLSLTPAAEESGAWYGTADYRSGLKALWGVK